MLTVGERQGKMLGLRKEKGKSRYFLTLMTDWARKAQNRGIKVEFHDIDRWSKERFIKIDRHRWIALILAKDTVTDRQRWRALNLAGNAKDLRRRSNTRKLFSYSFVVDQLGRNSS